jgi:hypothetical protein
VSLTEFANDQPQLNSQIISLSSFANAQSQPLDPANLELKTEHELHMTGRQTARRKWGVLRRKCECGNNIPARASDEEVMRVCQGVASEKENGHGAQWGEVEFKYSGVRLSSKALRGLQ